MNNYQFRPREANTEKHQEGETRATALPLDTVEISLEARKKLAELADQALRDASRTKTQLDILPHGGELTKAEGDNEPGGTANRKYAMLEQVQERIKTDFYNRPEVKGEIARRLADELAESADETEDDPEQIDGQL